MLSTDVQFEGWTTEAWTRFLHLWKPRALGAVDGGDAGRPRGGVMAIHEAGRLRKLLHTRSGRIPIAGPAAKWPMPLSELARDHHASWALSAHAGALEEVMERFGARAKRHDDLVAQSLSLVQIAREMMVEGAIESWPRRLHGVPPPTESMVRRAIDALCPEGRTMALGVFKDGELWTAFVARRSSAGFDVLAGPEELGPRMGVLSGDWRRDYRHLARAVEERYAPLAFGCFAEVATFRALQVDARPGAWGRAVAVRDIVLSPIPMAVGLALGVDGVRFAFENLKVLTGRYAPVALLDPFFGKMRARLGSAAGDKDVRHTLGFDPMAALRALLRR